MEEESGTEEVGRSWLLLTIPASTENILFIGVALAAVFLFLSAFVSAAEVAFFSINNHQQRHLEGSSKRTDRLIREFLSKPRRLLASILIYNTLFNVATVAVLYWAFSQWVTDPSAEKWQIALAVTTTFVVILFGEVLPKQYASNNNLMVARMTVVPLRAILYVFSPLVKLLISISDMINRQLEKRHTPVTSSDLQQAIDLAAGQEEGSRDTRMLKRIVNFGSLTVTEIMQSRMDVVAVEEQTTYFELLEVVRESGYSRIPVYREDFDHVVGILYSKDLIRHIGENEDFKWQELLRETFFVPESKKIDSLLEEFRHKRIHMAVVVDEYGGSAGIITLEDVLEEVIGEIKDEFDEALEIDYKRIDKNNYIFEGKTPLIDFCNILDIPADIFDDVRGEADTLAGLMLELKHEMPKTGDLIHYGNFHFKILTVNKARISRIRVNLVPNTTED